MLTSHVLVEFIKTKTQLQPLSCFPPRHLFCLALFYCIFFFLRSCSCCCNGMCGMHLAGYQVDHRVARRFAVTVNTNRRWLREARLHRKCGICTNSSPVVLPACGRLCVRVCGVLFVWEPSACLGVSFPNRVSSVTFCTGLNEVFVSSGLTQKKVWRETRLVSKHQTVTWKWNQNTFSFQSVRVYSLRPNC